MDQIIAALLILAVIAIPVTIYLAKQRAKQSPSALAGSGLSGTAGPIPTTPVATATQAAGTTSPAGGATQATTQVTTQPATTAACPPVYKRVGSGILRGIKLILGIILFILVLGILGWACVKIYEKSQQYDVDVREVPHDVSEKDAVVIPYFILDDWDGQWGRKKVARLNKGVTYQISITGVFMQAVAEQTDLSANTTYQELKPQGYRPEDMPIDPSLLPLREARPLSAIGFLGSSGHPFPVGELTEVTPEADCDLYIGNNSIQDKGAYIFNRSMPDGTGWRVVIKTKG